MSEPLSFFLSAFVSLFAIVDAIGNAPIFLSITPRNTPQERAAMVRKTSIAVFVILVSFMILGNRLFGFFGITIDAFRIAGGLILLKIALDMVEAKSLRTRHTPEEDQEGLAREDVAIIPLAIPMLSGPGAISTVIVLTGQIATPAQMMAVGHLASRAGIASLLILFVIGGVLLYFVDEEHGKREVSKLTAGAE